MRPFESFRTTARRLAALTANFSGTIERAPAQVSWPTQPAHNLPPSLHKVSDIGSRAGRRGERAAELHCAAEREAISLPARAPRETKRQQTKRRPEVAEPPICSGCAVPRSPPTIQNLQTSLGVCPGQPFRPRDETTVLGGQSRAYYLLV